MNQLEKNKIDYDVYEAVVASIIKRVDLQLPVKYKRERSSSIVGSRDGGGRYRVNLTASLLKLDIPEDLDILGI